MEKLYGLTEERKNQFQRLVAENLTDLRGQGRRSNSDKAEGNEAGTNIFPFKISIVTENIDGTDKKILYVNKGATSPNSTIYIGTEALYVGEENLGEINITADKYVNLYVNYDRTSDEYSYEIKTEDNAPEQSNTKYGVILGIIHPDYSISQMQTDDITVQGRVV